jgi:hypothetical protein
LGGGLGGVAEQAVLNLALCRDDSLWDAFQWGAFSGGVGGGLGHLAQLHSEPVYLGEDSVYGHRWSDGGLKYGRLSPEQVRQLRRMAKQGDITVVGGWAETRVGLENRRLAMAISEGERVSVPGVDSGVEVPWWRNTGLPGGKDLDIWTPRPTAKPTDLPRAIRMQLAEIFGVDVGTIDNYNAYADWRGSTPPWGSITFHSDGTVTRVPAPWQEYHLIR